MVHLLTIRRSSRKFTTGMSCALVTVLLAIVAGCGGPPLEAEPTDQTEQELKWCWNVQCSNGLIAKRCMIPGCIITCGPYDCSVCYEGPESC